MRYTGVTSRGIITPIFRQGDDLAQLVCDSIMQASKEEGFQLHDRDVVGVTEAVVARTQGNYASVEQIAEDVRSKLGDRDIGIVFPILSRNRFSILLRAIAMACRKLYIQLSYPADEVGNELISQDDVDDKGINPYTDSFDERGFRAIFGENTAHRFTGVDYVQFYKSMGRNIEVIFSNDPRYILHYTKNIINCDIHSRKRTNRILKDHGGERVYSLDQLMTAPVNGSGYNETYGLLGTNKATEDSVKLFPRDCQSFVERLQQKLLEASGKHMEVLVYGDGGFKDPVGGIWELADPVISPGFTEGLRGTPNELKMKYFADNDLKDLSGEALNEAMREMIRQKDSDLKGSMGSQGTTPRQLTDLLGSLCDLTSGSGDRGTPVVLIQNYFTNFASE